jgi:hypothetical protein
MGRLGFSRKLNVNYEFLNETYLGFEQRNKLTIMVDFKDSDY